jgi:hypothetical protein
MIILHLVLLNWIYFHLGLSNAGPWYAFWGGFGSDIGELSIFLAMGTMIAHQARIHNCEVHRCWRLRRHTTAAGHQVCRRHHPSDHLTAEGVTAAHKAALAVGKRYE